MAQEIEDPEVKMSVWRRRRASKIAGASNAADRRELREHTDLPLTALGSGSDYASFLDFLGIPCVSLDFADESNDAAARGPQVMSMSVP
ncbi:MAG TPA: hypothetical protein VN578_09950 [Candidatus Binatia bacterium]|nr:hypothetical protein [Candidatus Binatia bacterium]